MMVARKPSLRSDPTCLNPAETGTGGELHQLPSDRSSALTTNQGVVIADDQNSLKANSHGPSLLEDFVLREKITHFDHERIPERIVHARGSGAHGFFELTQSLIEYTRADFLQNRAREEPHRLGAHIRVKQGRDPGRARAGRATTEACFGEPCEPSCRRAAAGERTKAGGYEVPAKTGITLRAPDSRSLHRTSAAPRPMIATARADMRIDGGPSIFF